MHPSDQQRYEFQQKARAKWYATAKLLDPEGVARYEVVAKSQRRGPHTLDELLEQLKGL